MPRQRVKRIPQQSVIWVLPSAQKWHLLAKIGQTLDSEHHIQHQVFNCTVTFWLPNTGFILLTLLLLVLFYSPGTCTVTAAAQTSLCCSPDCVTSSPARSWWRSWGTELRSQVNTWLLTRQQDGPLCQSVIGSRGSRNYEHAVCIIINSINNH